MAGPPNTPWNQFLGTVRLEAFSEPAPETAGILPKYKLKVLSVHSGVH